MVAGGFDHTERNRKLPDFRKDNMQDEQVQNRLTSLKTEFEAGQVRLRELETELVRVRETMLRISGAIQVLEELADKSNPGTAAAETTTAATRGVGP
jgi:predicted nuclease with TOPRIM domain